MCCQARRLYQVLVAVRESLIEAYFVAQVKAMGGEVRKVRWIGRRGAPDRVAMLPPPRARTIWPEFKATGVAPEDYQLREHARMRKMGQRVEVVDSFERVDEILR